MYKNSLYLEVIVYSGSMYPIVQEIEPLYNLRMVRHFDECDVFHAGQPKCPRYASSEILALPHETKSNGQI